MKSSKRMFIICLLTSMIFSGFIYAQNHTTPNSTEPTVTQSFVADDLLAVLDVLSSYTGVNIIYDSAVQGLVTCNLENVPLSKAIEIVLAATPYKAQKKDGYYLVNEPMQQRYACQISGNVGIANVKMEGLPDNIITDEKGYYKANVTAGFSGKVQPVKEGYKFNPSFVIYNNINSDRKKNDYKTTKMSPDEVNGNELKDPVVTQEFFADDLLAVLDLLAENTKVNIMYDETVQGMVNCKLKNMPLSKALEMIFSASPFIIKRMDEYYLITSPQRDDIKNRVLEPVTISGNVGLEGVEMQGFPGNVVTDSDGSYSVTVDYDFTGTIKPVKEGYEFSPQSIEYKKTESDYTDQDYKAVISTYTIEGNVGVGGVLMQGLPRNPVTDRNGYYSVAVPYGWSGVVKPKKEGYTFVPADKSFVIIDRDYVEDFYAEAHKYEISGNVGIEGVEIQGLPKMVYSDAQGNYSVLVDYDFSGTAKPVKAGYTFRPATRVYTKVTSDKKNADYAAELMEFHITGSVGIEGVQLVGLPNEVQSGEKGSYSTIIESGWSGRIQPVKEGYSFSPPIRQYSNVTRDITNQNYNAQVQMLTISDVIEFDKNKPISGVNITANPGNIRTVTDSKGQFSFQVPYGWSGDITFSKTGISFSPDKKSYTNVTTDIINGIPVPATNLMETVLQYPDNLQALLNNRSVGRRILFVPSDDIDSKNIKETKEDVLVMAEILDERFREPQLIEGVLRDFGDFFGRDNKQTEAIYMQGYGLVFMMEVNYRFSPLSQNEEKVETLKNGDSDQTWERARQRVLSPKEETRASAGEYEKQMINILKTELVRTLKYASNIRNIKSEEWVILSVSGAGTQSRPLVGGGIIGGMMGGGYGTGYGMGGGYGGGMMGGGYSGGMGGMMGGYGMPLSRSVAEEVMTMRVKKNDIDEFSSGNVDFEKFQEKVQIFMN